MKKHTLTTVLLVGILLNGINLHAQQGHLDAVKLELERITELEIEAFKNGDCDTAINFMADNITFYGNGRKVDSKETIRNFCKRLTRPFEKPSSIETKFYPLDSKSAYVVRIMEFAENNKIYKKEIVTKIWKKMNANWKIVHLHSTIKQLNED